MSGAEHAAELVLEHVKGPGAVIGIIVGGLLAWPHQSGGVPVKGPLGTVNAFPVWHNAFMHSLDLGKVVAAGVGGGLVVAAFVAVVVKFGIEAFKSSKPKPSATPPPPSE